MIHASLFSGIGGPEVAAAMLGWENAFHCEINPFGRAVLEYWFPESKSYEDITKTDFHEWRGKVDVLTGGFPCQPFSYAGKRGGRDDERYLWPQMLRAIDEIRPTWVVGENVAGITTMVEGGILTPVGCDPALFGEGDGLHRFELRQSFTIERICRDLEGLGYSVQPMLIPAAAVGAPHRRDRIFILANAENALGNRPGIGRDEKQRDKWDFGDFSTGSDEWLCAEKGADAPNAEDVQRDGGFIGYEGKPGGEPVSESGNGSGKNDATNSNRTLYQRRDGQTKIGRRGSELGIKPFDSELFPEERWADFPTVSPVHAGNDGLPLRMDGISIPFTKWRTEALKAYGNAIVPQVMYRIFQAIESV